MNILHQVGHNSKWNIDSLTEDSAGNGLILSPVNIKYDKIVKLDSDLRKVSIFDPQFYLPKEPKSNLSTYDFFPANLKNDFQTSDFENIGDDIARACIDFQIEREFIKVVIPTRHYNVLPTDYYDQMYHYLVEPFLRYYTSQNYQQDILLTIIVNESQVMNEDEKSKLLNWLTSIQEIDGVYLILDNNFNTKQIKNAEYLYNVLTIIHSLRLNDMEVHLGYTNTEGLLYSIADPNSVSMGSYENLRRFGINRFTITERQVQTQPNPRLYSRALYQLIDYGFIGAIQRLYDKWEYIFEDSKYKPLMFRPEYNWHFTKPEPYKHYFLVFSSQILTLPEQISDRIEYLKKSFQEAIDLFTEIRNAGVVLDDNSDGSHLSYWITSINMYLKYLKDNSYEI